jgi:tRNA dimethylallyltransferase
MDKLLCIAGTTATGKTRLAVAVAKEISGEIISADSRQVYRGMDIGTGKDLEEYDGVPYHLIDIANPGEEYNVFRFKKDFTKAYNEIKNRGNIPVLCGGSGMYIDAVVNDYRLDEVSENRQLRETLEQKSTEELISLLKNIRTLHNTTDITDRQRCIRAIEIEYYYREHPGKSPEKVFEPVIFIIDFDRKTIRDRITKRLSNRLENGMVEEVRELLESGVSAGMLKFYGLEYRFINSYIQGEITYEEMFSKLNTAIHQFAKRQETWWRRMEKRGTVLHRIDGRLTPEQKKDAVLKIFQQR